MGRLLGAVLLAGIVALEPALAQNPMSPIYPTGPAKPRPARPPVKEITPAPDHEGGKPLSQAPASPAEEGSVATAVIPPPAVAAPPTSSGAKTPGEKSEDAAEAHQAVKHHRRPARRTRYARRLYAPDPAGWYYDNAANRGWGGGQFGPSPYSSNGQ